MRTGPSPTARTRPSGRPARDVAPGGSRGPGGPRARRSGPARSGPVDRSRARGRPSVFSTWVSGRLLHPSVGDLLAPIRTPSFIGAVGSRARAGRLVPRPRVRGRAGPASPAGAARSLPLYRSVRAAVPVSGRRSRRRGICGPLAGASGSRRRLGAPGRRPWPRRRSRRPSSVSVCSSSGSLPAVDVVYGCPTGRCGQPSSHPPAGATPVSHQSASALVAAARPLPISRSVGSIASNRAVSGVRRRPGT